MKSADFEHHRGNNLVMEGAINYWQKVVEDTLDRLEEMVDEYRALDPEEFRKGATPSPCGTSPIGSKRDGGVILMTEEMTRCLLYNKRLELYTNGLLGIVDAGSAVDTAINKLDCVLKYATFKDCVVEDMEERIRAVRERFIDILKPKGKREK